MQITSSVARKRIPHEVKSLILEYCFAKKAIVA